MKLVVTVDNDTEVTNLFVNIKTTVFRYRVIFAVLLLYIKFGPLRIFLNKLWLNWADTQKPFTCVDITWLYKVH